MQEPKKNRKTKPSGPPAAGRPTREQSPQPAEAAPSPARREPPPVGPPTLNVGAPVTPARAEAAPAAPSQAPARPSPAAPAPVTPAPVTPAPVTPAPVTPAPVTPAPVTAVPAPTAAAPRSSIPDVWRIGPARPAAGAPSLTSVGPEHPRAAEALLDPKARWSGEAIEVLKEPGALSPGQLAQLDLSEADALATPLLGLCHWPGTQQARLLELGWGPALTQACELLLSGATLLHASVAHAAWWQVRALEDRLSAARGQPLAPRLAPVQSHGLAISIESERGGVRTLELLAGPGLWLWLAQPSRLGSEQSRRLGASIRTGGVRGGLKRAQQRRAPDMSAMTGNALWGSQVAVGMMDLEEQGAELALQVIDRQGQTWSAHFTRAAALAAMAWPLRPEVPESGSAESALMAHELLRPGSWRWAAADGGHVLEERNWSGHYRLPQFGAQPLPSGGREGSLPLASTPLGELDPDQRGAAWPAPAWRPLVAEACMLALSGAQTAEDRALAARIMVAMSSASDAPAAGSAPLPGPAAPGALRRPGPAPAPTKAAALPPAHRMGELAQAVAQAADHVAKLQARQPVTPNVARRDTTIEALIALMPELQEVAQLLKALRR